MGEGSRQGESPAEERETAFMRPSLIDFAFMRTILISDLDPRCAYA